MIWKLPLLSLFVASPAKEDSITRQNCRCGLKVRGLQVGGGDALEYMPWKNKQRVALRDAVKKNTMAVSKDKSIVLWWALACDTPELSNYPLHFLLSQFRRD